MADAHYLDAKSVLVTGGSRGIGLAIAARAAKAGARVAIAGRTVQALTAAKANLERQGLDVLAVPADVSDPAQVTHLIDTVEAALGGIDVLVNNAGSAPVATIDQMSLEVFDEMVAANVRSVFLCSKAVWPLMTAAGGGAIVNISSRSAYDAFPGLGAYGAAKAFVVAYTRSLAAEGAPHNIRVFGIAPGAVETAMLRGAFPSFPAEQTLSPDAIAMAVEAVLAPAFQHSSGQTVSVSL